MSLDSGTSSDVFDHLDELVDGVSLPASELDQLPHLLDDGAALGCPGHGDSASASKLEQPFVLKQPQRAQDGVGVDSENGREVSGGFGLSPTREENPAFGAATGSRRDRSKHEAAIA